MDSVFCRSCGTLIAENEEFCSCCGRMMDWHNRKQLDCYVHPKAQTTKTVKKQDIFPNCIFLEDKKEETQAILSKQETETIACVDVPNDFHTENDWIVKIPNMMKEETSEISVLSFGEMVLLIVCALIPILGTIILAIASFLGDKKQNINRQTAAKALLLAQLVVMLTIVTFFAFFFQYFLLFLPY